MQDRAKILERIARELEGMTVRQTLTAPLAGALQSAFAGGGLFGLFHEGGIAGERPPAMRYAYPGIFEHAPRYHGGGFAGSGLLSDEVPIIARRGELVVPAERCVREEKSVREQRPITVVVNVTADEQSEHPEQYLHQADLRRQALRRRQLARPGQQLPADRAARSVRGQGVRRNTVGGRAAAATSTSALFGIYRWGWGFSTFALHGDIALIAVLRLLLEPPAMVRRWHADPFGFLRPWNEVPALIGSAPPATPPSTGTGVVTFLMG